jgi:uncharacterized damage-inducible protein DinB/predicted RNase H-like HicB family nuclease
MTAHQAYLEASAEGLCMAHIPALPGCCVRAETRDSALQQLPQAIRNHHEWLQRHGEPAPPEGAGIEIKIAGESTGGGPFDRGDVAALFAPDREPVSPDEMEMHFRLMAHARHDLLALVQDLPDDLLAWQADRDSMSLSGLLRHVGNAEEWYVSRLVEPDTLPREWEADEDLPVFEFLEMERRTAVARLRLLTEEERSGVFYPTHYTRHPEEGWTLRKVLRRAMEHELEHTAQVRQILGARRRYLLAVLKAERAGLLEQLLGLDEQAITETQIAEGWTIKELLAHLAAWDRWQHRAMVAMVAGETPDLVAGHYYDAANAAFVAPWRDRSLVEVLAELQTARGEWIAWLQALTEEEFYQKRVYEGHDWSFYGAPSQVQWQHDAEHAEQIAGWRKARGLKRQTGPKEILLATLDAARQELVAAADLIAQDRRASRPVCGSWTIQELVGHIADWEWVGVEGLRDMAAGRQPQVEAIDDIEGWNQTRVRARRGELEEATWRDLHAARQALTEWVEGMSQVALSRCYPFPWGMEGTVYDWISVFVRHDREHSADIRQEQAGSDT